MRHWQLPLGQPTDWNQNGTPAEPHVAVDVSGDGALDVLEGYHDWPNTAPSLTPTHHDDYVGKTGDPDEEEIECD